MGLVGMNLALSTTSLVFVSILHITHGFGPAYGGDEFVRLKEIPPAVVAARASGSVTLACSVTGSPTPTVAWYRGGKRLAGTTSRFTPFSCLSLLSSCDYRSPPPCPA